MIILFPSRKAGVGLVRKFCRRVCGRVGGVDCRSIGGGRRGRGMRGAGDEGSGA